MSEQTQIFGCKLHHGMSVRPLFSRLTQIESVDRSAVIARRSVSVGSYAHLGVPWNRRSSGVLLIRLPVLFGNASSDTNQLCNIVSDALARLKFSKATDGPKYISMTIYNRT
ncbi:MAG: hypothetical protein OXG64_04220 [Chloroflexi bacterium]|nr:hypothetical protein [Chloroflexota bacterium]